MAARDGPVTGYPVPNPPPPGVAYPYTAPTNNAYYNDQNSNPYYQSEPDNVRHAIWLRRVLAFFIALVIIFAAIVFIVWLVHRPQLPQFRVNSLSLSNFSLSNTSLVSFSSDVNLTALNPNKKMTVHYDQLGANLFYELWSLSETMVPPFTQGTRNETSFSVRFVAAGSFLDWSATDGVRSDLRSDGEIGLNLRIVSRSQFQDKAWRTRWRLLKVFCGDLIVRFTRSNSSSSSGLLVSPMQCRVEI